MVPSRHSSHCAGAIKPAGGRYGKIDDDAYPDLAGVKARSSDVAAPEQQVTARLTGYAHSAMVHCNIFFLQRSIYYVMLRIDQGRNNLPRECGTKGTSAMIIDSLMNRARASIAKRRHYNRLVAEIESFYAAATWPTCAPTAREMLYQVHKQIYG